MKNKEELSPFVINFMGQNIIMTVALTSTVNDNGIIETYPVFYEGILVDQDKEFYYIAQKGNNPNIVVQKPHMVSIVIQDEKDLIKEMLNQIEPEGGDELSGKKIYLEDSLDHLKQYIEVIIGNDFDYIESQVGPGSRDFLKPMYENLMEKINHAIDHVKVDHCES